MSATKGKMTLTTPNDFEIVLTREFDAPRSLVFEVWTQPEHIKNWWGPCVLTMTVCEIDLRVGGSYRFVTRDPQGVEHPFKGIYKEIVPPERLVSTQIYDVEPYSIFEALVTAVFEDVDGRTRTTQTIRHQTKEARDGHLGAGMEWGAAESFDRLEEILARLQGERP
jgi:uncharacterized protein YndB with AHSA1/START domain